MIEAFVGLVGGGKTFSSTRRMCEYVVRGGVVATNILFKGYDVDNHIFASDSPFIQYLLSRGWRYQTGQYVYIPFDQMTDNSGWFHEVPAGESRSKRTLLCIDEATDLFDTLDRNKLNSDSVYRELFRFLRLSRHAHIDVLFICQDFFAINSRLRGLVGAIWKSTDMQHFRLPTFHIPLPINCFLLQKFDRTGKLELYREFLAKDARIFSIYDSEAFHDSLGITFSGNVPDGRIQGVKRMTRFQKIVLYGTLLLAIVILVQLRSQTKTFDRQFKKLESRLVLKGGVTADPIVAQKDSVTADPIVAQNEPVDKFVRGEFEYAYYGDHPVLYFDGALIKIGMITEYGKCIAITPESALCVTGEFRTFLLPLKRPDGPPKTMAFAPSVALSALD